MARPAPSSNAAPEDFLQDTQRNARRLRETLERYASELAASNELDAAVKEKGLAVVGRAVESARRLIASTDRSLARRDAGQTHDRPIPLPRLIAMNEPGETKTKAEIVARAGTYYRNARYIIIALALGAGLYFAYDGWIGYPAEREAYEHMTESQRATAHKPHTLLDIRLQKQIASVLIPLAPILLGFFLYQSRGEYRLSGTTLFVPGHPPVPFDAIVGFDKSKWDRKGIIQIDYKLQEGAPTQRLTLDDFIYDQVATDAIVDTIDEALNPDAGKDQIASDQSNQSDSGSV